MAVVSFEQNRSRAEGIWLVSYKKDTGKPRFEYDEAVEEALSFGWVDSKPTWQPSAHPCSPSRLASSRSSCLRADLCQQDGFLHAGIVTTIVDSACGYAALTLMAVDARVLSVEFKINFLAPAVGDRFIARGLVVRAGRTITVCTGEVVAFAGDTSDRSR